LQVEWEVENLTFMSVYLQQCVKYGYRIEMFPFNYNLTEVKKNNLEQ